MVGGKDISAGFLYDRNDLSHLRLDFFDIVPEDGVDPAVKDQVVSVLFLDGDRVHAGFDLEWIQRVDANLDEFRDKRPDVAAGMKMGIDAVGACPVARSLLRRLEQLAVRIE